VVANLENLDKCTYLQETIFNLFKECDSVLLQIILYFREILLRNLNTVTVNCDIKCIIKQAAIKTDGEEFIIYQICDSALKQGLVQFTAVAKH
jgi:hypothetical protein